MHAARRLVAHTRHHTTTTIASMAAAVLLAAPAVASAAPGSGGQGGGNPLTEMGQKWTTTGIAMLGGILTLIVAYKFTEHLLRGSIGRMVATFGLGVIAAYFVLGHTDAMHTLKDVAVSLSP